VSGNSGSAGESHRLRWDERHGQADGFGSVAQVLLRNAHLLPARGRALDLACGRGANALWLAERGWEVHAWDFSPVAVERLEAEAKRRGLAVEGQVRDVVARPPEREVFDLVFVGHFLERSLAPALVEALRPGGLLFYQTFVREVNRGRGPGGDHWRLAPNELLRLFAGLRVHYYREDAPFGGDADELADLALLVASRPGRAASIPKGS